MSSAAASVVLKRARVGAKKRTDSEIYPSTIPAESEWIATHDIEMLMLDGYAESSLLNFAAILVPFAKLIQS
jgi:hypothetical protein